MSIASLRGGVQPSQAIYDFSNSSLTLPLRQNDNLVESYLPNIGDSLSVPESLLTDHDPSRQNAAGPTGSPQDESVRLADKMGCATVLAPALDAA